MHGAAEVLEGIEDDSEVQMGSPLPGEMAGPAQIVTVE